MHGRTFTYGVHPSGYLISDVPLAENFPLRWSAKDKKGVTQWDMRIAEELGFMKIDFLGLRNLDTLMKYNDVLVEQGKPTVDFYDVIRMDEDGELPDEMWEQVDNGFTVGIFQVEDGVKAKWLGRHIKPRCLEEIALLTALNRPGPLGSGAADRYIAAREGNPSPEIHPIVSKVAAESHGEIVYQEQLINFFVELGYDPKEADGVRKITGKKLRDEMAKLKDDYEKRFRERGADDEAVEKVWSMVEGFADYAFNKAHSVEYGLITLWTLFAKWLNPLEFYLASIKTLVAEGEKGEVPRYTREAKRYPHDGIEGYDILPVDINGSQVETSIEGDAIRYGFVDVKGIGRTAAEWLVNYRPFTSLENITEVASVPEHKITLKNGIHKVAVTKGHVEAIRKLTELEGEELYAAEEELLGYALSDNSASILEDYADEIADECVSIESLEDRPAGFYNIAGIITGIREAKTKAGQKMAWVTIENDGESIECPVWSNELVRLAFVWRRRQAVFASIKVDGQGRCSIAHASILHAKEN
jgi:DNA polymerase-3 subunit alpha